jgi:hypothetical protein
MLRRTTRQEPQLAFVIVSDFNQVALKRVIDEVAAHVIEPEIFLHLPQLLDPSDILKMSQTDIDSIAEESDARKVHRQLLQSKLDTLSRSSLLCKLYLENGAPLPYPNVVQQQSAEQTSSNGRTPSYDSDALGAQIQRDAIVEVSQDHEEVSLFDSLDTAAPDAPPVQATEAPLEEDMWNASTISKKGKKKSKKMVASLEEPAYLWP